MENILIEIESNDLKKNKTMIFDYPKNKDNLKIIVICYKKSIRAWVNICPHDGRPLVNDVGFLWEKKKKQLQCLNHFALFDPLSGECKFGPCLGANLAGLNVKEIKDKILVYKN